MEKNLKSMLYTRNKDDIVKQPYFNLEKEKMSFQHSCRGYLLGLEDPPGMVPAHIQCEGTHVALWAPETMLCSQSAPPTYMHTRAHAHMYTHVSSALGKLRFNFPASSVSSFLREEREICKEAISNPSPPPCPANNSHSYLTSRVEVSLNRQLKSERRDSF